eukprot:gnl/TRDRNA2_/TRDRNA2_177406_c0_seq2.p1 gnl/TRDRNA2_/TRDRNA2_177406_c0~~gnl/TRDRNA2_/TRDRNA2_177406_c0_seq2.p1  ORF type:complete len:146 (+),score=8.80 gnl/TRDRNA2_/TRDRNA2_177406_c0_seq2:272-709(+)
MPQMEFAEHCEEDHGSTRTSLGRTGPIRVQPSGASTAKDQAVIDRLCGVNSSGSPTSTALTTRSTKGASAPMAPHVALASVTGVPAPKVDTANAILRRDAADRAVNRGVCFLPIEANAQEVLEISCAANYGIILSADDAIASMSG